jgi:hypothetical protein
VILAVGWRKEEVGLEALQPPSSIEARWLQFQHKNKIKQKQLFMIFI